VKPNCRVSLVTSFLVAHQYRSPVQQAQALNKSNQALANSPSHEPTLRGLFRQRVRHDDLPCKGSLGKSHCWLRLDRRSTFLRTRSSIMMPSRQGPT
jgi:hypothetical protein